MWGGKQTRLSLIGLLRLTCISECKIAIAQYIVSVQYLSMNISGFKEKPEKERSENQHRKRFEKLHTQRV